jgi:Nickel responsive protein SCO4226-like
MSGRRAGRSVEVVLDQKEEPMETYVILRRRGWRTAEELKEAAARSAAEGDRMADDIRWIRSYVLDETSGGVGTVCVYQASSPEAIRSHAAAAGLPVDEIVAVADTVLVRPDPVAVTA